MQTYSQKLPQILCENCAVQILHNLCTFLMPPHMFRTNFRGPLGTTPRTNFAQFSYTRGMFLKSASVQANDVSILGPCPSTVLRLALGRDFIKEDNETVLGTNPNCTHEQPKLYLEAVETVLDLYSDKCMFPFLLRGALARKVCRKLTRFQFQTDVAFLLAVGSFLLTAELFVLTIVYS